MISKLLKHFWCPGFGRPGPMIFVLDHAAHSLKTHF